MTLDFDLGALRRRPDVEAPNLVAVDAADRLLLDTAAELLTPDASVAVIGDAFGALTLGALAARERLAARPPRSGDGAGRHDAPLPIRVHQDPLLGELALRANAELLCEKYVFFAEAPGYVSLPLAPELVEGARVVLLRLPKSLDALDEIAQLIAAHAHPEVVVLAAGMVKHMTLAQNEVLGRYFGEVRAGLARQKARVVTASGPIASPPSPALWPKTFSVPELGLELAAHGGVFAGTGLDIGTRFLLQHLDEMPQTATAIDLGCGNGVLAVALAARRLGTSVIASDQSAAAVASARETARLNGVVDRVEVRRDDALSTHPDASAELILMNPPFHSGTTVTAEVGLRLIADAGRVLAPGGQLWLVFNSHLRYQATLRRLVGPTRELARNSKFTITASTKR